MTGVVIFTLIRGIFIRRSFFLNDWWVITIKFTLGSVLSRHSQKNLYTNARNRGCTVTNKQSSIVNTVIRYSKNFGVVTSLNNYALLCKWEPENKRNSTKYHLPRILFEVSVETWVSHHSHTTTYRWHGNVYRHHGKPGESVSQSQ
jgi:hypothetical protein